MRNLLRRIQLWRQLGQVQPAAENAQARGGREGEQWMQALVESHSNFKQAWVYANKRVPSGTGSGRREIDLIVVTPKRLHIIEVKNWSGTLQQRNRDWVQTNRNGHEILHPNLVRDHRDKGRILLDYLRRQGVTLDRQQQQKYLSYKVILTNPRLEVLSAEITQHADVLLAEQLDAYLQQQRRSSLGARVMSSLVQWCQDSETKDSESAQAVVDRHFDRLSNTVLNNLRSALDRLSTWDTLHYYGLQSVTGDLLYLRLGDHKIARQQLSGQNSLKFRWSRSRVWGFLKAITGLGSLGILRVSGSKHSLGETDYALFQPAGRPEPIKIRLIELRQMELGG